MISFSEKSVLKSEPMFATIAVDSAEIDSQKGACPRLCERNENQVLQQQRRRKAGAATQEDRERSSAAAVEQQTSSRAAADQQQNRSSVQRRQHERSSTSTHNTTLQHGVTEAAQRESSPSQLDGLQILVKTKTQHTPEEGSFVGGCQIGCAVSCVAASFLLVHSWEAER